MRRALAVAVAGLALLAVTPVIASDADAAAHPIAGNYTGHATGNLTAGFNFENHVIDNLVVGPHHDPAVFTGGIPVSHGRFDFGNESKRLYGHWCDHNHMVGHYETSRRSLTFHAHREGHGVEGHRCP